MTDPAATVPPDIIPTTPILPLKTRHHNPIGPLLLGVVVVFVLAAALGGAYYMSKLKQEISSSPAPLPTPSPTVEPSPEPETSPSPEASSSPKASAKPTVKPTTIPSPHASPSPTPTPYQPPTFDLRFGNPAGNSRQTIDDGSGNGREINREYTSVQIGQFDEVKQAWSPRVTVCFHLVANENVSDGKLVKYSLTLDDKEIDSGTLSQYDRLESGRLYDYCHDATIDLGRHSLKLTVNGDKSLKESNHSNNFARVDYENLTDNIAPNFTLSGPYDWGENGTCFLIPSAPTDNVSTASELKLEQKVDGGTWSSMVDASYCFQGTSGSAHSFAARVLDARGNKNEQNKTFNLF